MQTIFHLPEVFADDSKKFREQTERLASGTISAAEFRSFRVPLGVYEQRESDTYMLRVRFPAGGVLPDQMRALAAVARRYGSGVLHVTSRQDIQVHRVRLEDIPAAFAELWDAGLSTRGGGGNTVRNITGCCDASVCPLEVFDPSPYALALTEFLLPDPLSYQLPRKYKIAFAGCPEDCPGATVNDLGFFARYRDGKPGFAVCVGGGMGAHSRVAEPLEEFVPAAEVHLVAEAVKRVFDKHGNRKNRHKARLRFLIEKIGLEAFRRLYEEGLAALRRAGVPDLQVRESPAGRRCVPAGNGGPHKDFALWRGRVVTPQRQPEYHLVEIPLWLGDIDSDTLAKLADLVARHGDGTLRTTQQQNLVLRWVHESELPGLHAELNGLGLASREPAVLRNMVACTGASTCKLGICLSRGLATAIRQALVADGLDLDALGRLKIHVSGCPNACGRHPVADLGFFGAVRRVKGRLVPHYVFQLGGRLGEGRTRLAEGQQTVPARDVPKLVAELLYAFCQSAWCSDFAGFLEAGGRRLAEDLARKYREVPDFEADRSYYFDWGAEEAFSLAGRGPGECGAGVFDLIEVDLASARDAVGQGRAYEATLLAARSLLVTRGEEGRDEAEVLGLFTRHFLDEKLVDESFRATIEQAQQAAATPQPAGSFGLAADEVSPLVETVQKLYDEMDPSLRFRPVTRQPAPPPPPSAAPKPQVAREADLRGVVCPLNYVKTKMLLDQIQRGEVLSVLVDEQGARNVPESVRKDGHDVLSADQEGQQWRLLIRKA